MTIANEIRQGAMNDEPWLNDASDLRNKVVSAFMQRGDWLNSYTHAITFALLVAEALDDGAGE